MIYITTDQANRITEVIDGDRDPKPPGAATLTDAQAATLATHPVGFAAFDYIGSALVENTSRQAARTLKRNRLMKIRNIDAHKLELIGALVPALANAATMDLLVELYQAGAFAAGFPTAGSDIDKVTRIYIYARGKISQARTATQAQLDAYDPATDPNWPT